MWCLLMVFFGYVGLGFHLRWSLGLEVLGARDWGIQLDCLAHGSSGTVGLRPGVRFGFRAAVHLFVGSGLRRRLRLHDNALVHAEVETLGKTSGTEQRGQGNHSIFQIHHASPFSNKQQLMCNTRAIRICSRRIKVLARWRKNARTEKCRPGTTQRCNGPTRGLISQRLDLSQTRDIARAEEKAPWVYLSPCRIVPCRDST